MSKPAVDAEQVIKTLEDQSVLRFPAGTMGWDSLDKILDHAENALVRNVEIKGTHFIQSEDLEDVFLSLGKSTDLLEKITIEEVDLRRFDRVGSDLLNLTSAAPALHELHLSGSKIGDLFLGSVIALIRISNSLMKVDLNGASLPADGVDKIKNTILATKKIVEVTLPDGKPLQLSAVEAPPPAKKRTVKKPSTSRGLEFSTKAFNDYPRFLIKADAMNRVGPSDNFYYCTKCQEICSVQRSKKDILVLFNPYKIELSTSTITMKGNYGKNANEKICPICNIYIQESEYTTEDAEGKKKVVSYFKCRFCLWNTLHFNISLESTLLIKVFSELSKRHKLVREKDLLDTQHYILNDLKNANAAAEKEEIRQTKQGAGKNVAAIKDDKTNAKAGWDVHKLYYKFNLNKRENLIDNFKHDQGRRLQKHSVPLFPPTEEQKAQEEAINQEKKKEDEESDKNSSCSSDSNSKLSGLNNAEITDAIGQLIGNMMDTMPSPDRSNADDPAHKIELEKIVMETFKDAPHLLDNPVKQSETLDEFLESYKQQRIFTNIFEQLPTKVFNGYESLIPLDSTLVPVLNKSCAQDHCKNGLFYYDKSSDYFSIKFSSGLYEYIPTLRLLKIQANTPPGYTTYKFNLWNKTKYSARSHYSVPANAGSNYRLKGDSQEIDLMFAANEKDGATNLQFEVEVLDTYSGDVALNVESNLFMQDAENLVVKYQLLIQLGDEDAKKSYFIRYKQ